MSLFRQFFEECLSPRQGKEMTLSIEVGMVVGGLKILTAEGFVLYPNGTLAGVEHGNAPTATHAMDGLDDGLEAGPIDMPRRDEANGGFGIFVAQATTKQVEGIGQHLQGIAIVTSHFGIVVPGYHQHDIGRVRHFQTAVHDGPSEAAVTAVPGNGAAIAAVVAIVPSLSLGREIVPALGLGTTVVGDIAVTDDNKRWLCHRCMESETQYGKKEKSTETIHIIVCLLSGQRQLHAETEILRDGGISIAGQQRSIALSVVVKIEGDHTGNGIAGLERGLDGLVTTGGFRQSRLYVAA